MDVNVDGLVVHIHNHAASVVAVVADRQSQELLREYHHLLLHLRRPLGQTCSILDGEDMLNRDDDDDDDEGGTDRHYRRQHQSQDARSSACVAFRRQW